MSKSYLAAGLALMALASCDQASPDVKACEGYIKANLLAPSTYKRIGVLKTDQAMTAPEFTAAVGLDHQTSTQQLALRNEAARGLALRTVSITYESENGFGVPVREDKICAFKVVGGVPEVAPADRDGARLDKAVRELNDKIGVKKAPFECCLT